MTTADRESHLEMRERLSVLPQTEEWSVSSAPPSTCHIICHQILQLILHEHAIFVISVFGLLILNSHSCRLVG